MGRFAVIVVSCLLAVTTGCDDYPRDPGGSLREAKKQKLRVGIIHSPPWTDLQGARPAGEEVDIVQSFAATLGTEVEWVPGSEGQLMPILSSQELHIVIGGLTQQNPWSEHVGFTDSYLTVPVVVAPPTARRRQKK